MSQPKDVPAFSLVPDLPPVYPGHRPCECFVKFEEGRGFAERIEYCPLHAAAPEMLALLGELVRQNASIENERAGVTFNVLYSARALLARIEGQS